MSHSTNHFLTADEKKLLKHTKRRNMYDSDDFGYIYSNIIDSFEIDYNTNRDLYNRFNEETFRRMLIKTCIDVYDINDSDTFEEVKDMTKDDLYFIHLYSTKSNKIQIASPKLYNYMFIKRETPYREPFSIIQANKVNLIGLFLKYGSTHPKGFNEDKWVSIAIKLLNQFGVKCYTDTEKLNTIINYLNERQHNQKIIQEREDIMNAANTGGNKYNKKTVKELQQLCIKHKIKYSGLRKADLIKTLMLHKIK